MALPQDAPGAPPTPSPLDLLAGLLEAQPDSTVTVPLLTAAHVATPLQRPTRFAQGCPLGSGGAPAPGRGRCASTLSLVLRANTADSTALGHRSRQDLLLTEHAALMHLNASLQQQLLKHREARDLRDAVGAEHQQRAADVGVEPADSKDTSQGAPSGAVEAGGEGEDRR